MSRVCVSILVCLLFLDVNYTWQREIGANAVHKILVKVTIVSKSLPTNSRSVDNHPPQ